MKDRKQFPFPQEVSTYFNSKKYLRNAGYSASVIGVTALLGTQAVPPAAHAVESSQSDRNSLILSANASAIPWLSESFSQAESDPALEAVIIDGVETYGHNEALTQTQLDTLIQKLNEKAQNGEVETRPDVLYGIWLADPETYQQFKTENGESLQTYVKRLFAVKTQMLRNGNTYIAQSGYQIDSAKLRSVIHVRSDASPPGSWHNEYVLSGPHRYADGWWGFWGDRPHRPRTHSWWMSDKQVSGADLHELGHAEDRLSDDYGFDSIFDSAQLARHFLSIIQNSKTEQIRLSNRLKTTPNELITKLQKLAIPSSEVQIQYVPEAFEGIALHWQRYVTNERTNDPNGGTLMDLPNSGRYSSYAMWRFADRMRLGKLHDSSYVIPEAGAYPLEMSNINILHFGSQYDGQKVTIYRTGGEYDEREINEVASGTIVNGEINIGNPFSDPSRIQDGRTVVDDYKSVLFIRVGNDKFLWTDVRYFIQGFAKAKRPEKGVRYHMSLADNSMAYGEYNWTSQNNAESLDQPTVTPTRTPSPTNPPTYTPTRTFIPTATRTKTPTRTVASSQTPSPTDTIKPPTFTPTLTPPRRTPSPTVEMTKTPTPTHASHIETQTPSNTPTPSRVIGTPTHEAGNKYQNYAPYVRR